MGKKTYRATMAQSKEALWQPQKNRQHKRSLQEVTVNTEMTDAREARLQDLRTLRIQGRSPTVHENGPVQRRAADTARHDAADENLPETCEM